MDILNQLIEEWFALQPLKTEYQAKLDQKFRLEFNYNSNHLEGNTLTYGETKLLLLFEDTKGNHNYREYQEMEAHDVALKMIEEEAADKERPLTENFIRKLNEIILVKPFWKDAVAPDGQKTRRLIDIGEYKKYPNSVILDNGEIFEYASPFETPILMKELVDWYRQEFEKNELSFIELASLLHYKFIRIHPFDDGNGRVARLLVNYVMFYNNLPPIIIKSSDKKNYLRALHRADAGFIEDFTGYMKEQLTWSLDVGLRAAKGENIEEPDDLDKKIHLLKKELFAADDKVKIKYSEEAVKNVVENSIFPLLLAWEEKLKKFDDFFLDRHVNVETYDDSDKVGAAKVINLYQKNFNITIHKNHKEESGIFNMSAMYAPIFGVKKENDFSNIIRACKKLYIYINIQGLRSVDSHIKINTKINFTFHSNAYEINYLNQTVSKLYHQQLTEVDIENIALDLGNALYKEIEKAKESKT